MRKETDEAEIGENKQGSERVTYRQRGEKEREREEMDRRSGGEEKGSSCSSGGEVMRVVLQLSLQAEQLQSGHNEVSLTASPAASRTHTPTHTATCTV